MVDKLLFVINFEYFVGLNLIFFVVDLYFENNNINYNIVYIYVYYIISLLYRDISSIFVIYV